MEYTENLSLKKPEESDYYNVEDANGNMEILDDVIANDVMPKLNKKEIARFTSSGTYTIPDGVSEIDVYVVAGGCAGKGGMARLYTEIAVNAGDSFSYVVGAGTNTTTTYGGSTSFGTAAQIVNDYSSLSTRDLYAASKSYNAVNPYDGRFYGQWSSMYPVTTEITPAGVKPTSGSAATGTYGEIGGLGYTGTTATVASNATTGGVGGTGLVGGDGGTGGGGYTSYISGTSTYNNGAAGGVGGTGTLCGGDGGNGGAGGNSGTGGNGGNGGAATDYGGAGGDGGTGGRGATQTYTYGGDGGNGGKGYAGGGAGGLAGSGNSGFDGDSTADSSRAGSAGTNGYGGSGLIIIYA